MEINAIRQLMHAEMQQVDAFILNCMRSDIELIGQIGHHLVNSGGKRLRPLLVLLAAKACGYQGKQHIDLAAIIEFIHTATLLHDDVVDESLLRRGAETANAIWGNSASVLVGDFVYSRAFQMMVAINRLDVMKILANATNQIAEGEVLQLLNKHNPATTEAAYMQVIHYKTATLFEAATKLGAVIADYKQDQQTALADYGKYLGIAFQLIDDMLDYTGENIGKNIGDDLAEGKPTLPLIRAQAVATHEQALLIKQAIQQSQSANIDAIKTVISSTDALQYTYDHAMCYADKAISSLIHLPDSQYKQALIALAQFAVKRKQ